MFAAHHEKSFVPALFKVSVDHLFDKREFGGKNYCFEEKVWKKSLILNPQICTNHVY